MYYCKQVMQRIANSYIKGMLDFINPIEFYKQDRKWQPTPVFLPGESQGRGSLVGCRLWGRTELHTTEVT